MDVKTKKLDLIEWLVNLNDESVIEELYKLKIVSKENCALQLSEEEIRGIERGLKDYKEGRFSTHEEVTARIKSKFPFLK